MKGQILAAPLACVVVLLPAPPAGAVTKSQLYEACQAPKKSSSHIFCQAYLTGHFDGFSAGLVGMRPKRFCRPGVLTAEQIWEKVGPSLKPGQGQVGDEAAETVLAEALFNAYPCEKAK
jgi:hypothetical protein